MIPFNIQKLYFVIYSVISFFKEQISLECSSFFYCRYYAYIGLSALMAFIVLLLFGGLALGICGYHREDSPSNRTKTATCGGHCLMA